MCRNIRVLHNFAPPTTEAEIDDASLQYVRKVSGLRAPGKADEPAYARAVEEIASATMRLLGALPARGEVRTRDGERDKAKARWTMREAKAQG